MSQGDKKLAEGEGPMAERKGFYTKYIVRRADGLDIPGSKHHGCKYLVLDLTHNEDDRQTALDWARRKAPTNPVLAEQLVNLVDFLRRQQQEIADHV